MRVTLTGFDKVGLTFVTIDCIVKIWSALGFIWPSIVPNLPIFQQSMRMPDAMICTVPPAVMALVVMLVSRFRKPEWVLLVAGIFLAESISLGFINFFITPHYSSAVLYWLTACSLYRSAMGTQRAVLTDSPASDCSSNL